MNTEVYLWLRLKHARNQDEYSYFMLRIMQEKNK